MIQIDSRDPKKAYLSIGGECPFHCSYCYTRQVGFPKAGRRQNVSNLLGEIINLKQVGKVELVKMGCTSEIFVRRYYEHLIEVLGGLGFNVSFATKVPFPDYAIDFLRSVNQKMQIRDRVLVAFISLASTRTSRTLEHDVPAFEQRAETIVNLFRAGIPTYVYMKPILPQIPTQELEEVIALTEGQCSGRVIGSFVSLDEKTAIPQSQIVKPGSWLPGNVQKQIFEFEDPRIAEFLQRPNFFRTSDEAIENEKKKLLKAL